MRFLKVRRDTRGGMPSCGHAIYCDKCGKAATRVDICAGIVTYVHFTRDGGGWHMVRHAARNTRGAATLGKGAAAV